MESPSAPDRGIWVSANGKVQIEYLHRVLEDIRAAAVEGMCRFPRGGVEMGGVLLGCVRDGVVRVITTHPVECSYAMGPSFTLTETDEAAFRKAMGGGADLKPVGWYHSHTRSDLGFSAEDAAVHERLFSEPWQVALVIRPEPFGSAEAAFFARGEDGVMQSVPHGTILLRPAARASPSSAGARRTDRSAPSAEAASPRVQVMESDTPPEPEPAAPAASCISPEPSAPPIAARDQPPFVPPLPEPASTHPERPSENRGSRKGSPWFAFGGVVAAVAMAAILIWNAVYSGSTPAVPPHLALRVSEANGQLHITWDRNSPPLRKARGGAVSIRDGGQTITVPFDVERLRAGALTYARTSQDVEVRLKVEGPEPAEESVRLFGPAVSPRAPMPAPSAAPPSKRVEPRRPEPLERSVTADEVELATAETRAPAAGGRIRTDEPESEPALARPPRYAVPPERKQATAVLPQPPPVPAPPLLGKEGITVGLPSAGPPAGRRESGVSEIVRPSPPSAGRLIWVGRLERGEHLSIDGQRVSSGALTGELPGIPVRISAYPAELGGGQLRVFASSPGLRGTREAAGPQNGWNPTVYAWDARRTADVLVTEAPSLENRWRGISVRGNGRPVSVIVIDWRAAHP